MNGYIDTQVIVVKQIQAERRADAVAHRVAADWRRGKAPHGRAQHRVPWLRRLLANQPLVDASRTGRPRSWRPIGHRTEETR